MEKDKIQDKIQEICKDVFNEENLIININTNASDIAQWDSLNHLNLISSIEEEFDIKFDFEEIGSLKNIGDIIDIILNKKID
tara:strand:+ start:634 stop:879 length:246 start_codon:yes stop_codon:yes gene_type:complete